jgi:hypothetical protein
MDAAVSLLAGTDEPGFVGEHDRLHAVAKPKLHQNAGDVSLGRVLAHHELVGDLCVGEAARDESQDLELARRELVEARGFGRSRISSSTSTGE